MPENAFISLFRQPFWGSKVNKSGHGLDRGATTDVGGRLSVFCNGTMGVLIVGSAFNLLSGLYLSFYISLAALVVMLGLRRLIPIRELGLFRILSAMLMNFTILALCLVEGKTGGSYLYLFVFLVGTIFISDFKDKFSILATYLSSIGSLVVIMLAAPEHSVLQVMTPEEETANFNFTLICASMVSCIVSYFMLRESHLTGEKLQHKQKFLDSLYDTSLDALIIVDPGKLEIVDCNRRTLELFGTDSAASVRGTPLSTLFLELQTEDSEKFRALLTHPDLSWQGELTCITLAAKPFPGYISLVSFYYENKCYRKLNILDITELKRAGMELKAAKEKAELAAQTKSRFLSNMSHELRTPLNGIIGTTNLLLQEEYPSSQKQHFDVLRYSSEHMLNLVNDVLDFSKLEADKVQLELKAGNMRQFAEKMATLFRGRLEQKGIELILDARAETDRELMADFTRLNQVLTNLLANAQKFTRRGSVSLEIKIREANSEEAVVYFAVSDTGIGIPADKMAHIFESFTQGDVNTTRKFGGTGLGLSISRKLVKMMGGELEVNSEAGRGSCFHFSLTLAVNKYRSGAFVNDKAVSQLLPLDGIRVLVAEDNPVNMLVTARFLEKWSINLARAGNGLEALELFRRESFDLLLIDLEMPEMDGYATVAEIRQTDKDIPIIAFTAAVFDNMKQELQSKGFNGYIQKPFKPEDLHRKISEMSGHLTAKV